MNDNSNNFEKETDETIDLNIQMLENSLKNKSNNNVENDTDLRSENSKDAFGEITTEENPIKTENFYNKVKEQSEKRVEGKGDVVLHDDDLKQENKYKKNFLGKESIEHTYITGLGVIDDNNIFLSKVHLKKICSFLGLALILFHLISYIFPQIIKFLLSFANSNGTNIYNFIESSQSFNIILNIIVYIVVLSIPFLLYKFLIKIPFSVAFPKKKTSKGTFLELVFSAIMLAIIANIIGGIFSYFLSMIFGDWVNASTPNVPTDVTAFILFLISTAVLPAIIEEGIFRGIILQSLRPHGDYLAIIISSALFSICHGSIQQIVGTFIFGLVMGFIVIRTGSLKICMIAHFANNFLACIFAFINGELSAQWVNLIMYTLYLVIIAVGLYCVIKLSKKSKKLFDLPKKLDFLSTKEKAAVVFTNPALILGVLLTVSVFVIETIFK